jgi:hypothetical protein
VTLAPSVPGWIVGGHAHLGVLSILAIVLGFTVDAFGMTGRLRRAVSGLYVFGQWTVPLSVWIAELSGIGAVHALAFVGGPALIVSMLVMAWQAATTDVDVGGPAAARPADD